MSLWPFNNDKTQKVISTILLVVGIILFFNLENPVAGISLSLFGLVYLLDVV